MTSCIASAKIYLRNLAMLRKVSVQHSTTATPAIKAFLIVNICCFITLVRCLGITPHTVSYKHAQKLKSLLTFVVATVVESLPSERLAS